MKSTITLRNLLKKDLPALRRWRNDPATNRYLANRIKTKQDSEMWYRRIKSDSHNFLKGIQYNGRLIGYCVVEDIDRVNRKCEVGIIIGEPECRGKGIGTVVINQVLQYCFLELKLHRVLAVIARSNKPSEQLFIKLGFTHEGTLRDATVIGEEYMDLLCYSILESEYQEKRK